MERKKNCILNHNHDIIESILYKLIDESQFDTMILESNIFNYSDVVSLRSCNSELKKLCDNFLVRETEHKIVSMMQSQCLTFKYGVPMKYVLKYTTSRNGWAFKCVHCKYPYQHYHCAKCKDIVFSIGECISCKEKMNAKKLRFIKAFYGPAVACIGCICVKLFSTRFFAILPIHF